MGVSLGLEPWTAAHTSIYVEREREMFYLKTHSTHLWLYGVRHMIKDHSDSEKGNPLPPHRIPHTMAFVTPVVEHWLEREIAQWVHPMKDRSDDPSHHERMLYL